MGFPRLMGSLALLAVASVTAFAQGEPVPVPAPALRVTLDHLALHVRDLDTSARFYAEVLGLTEIPAAAPGRRWMSLSSGQALHLLDGRTQPVADVRSVHTAFQSDNLPELIRRLDARGIPWGNFQGQRGVMSQARTDGVRQIFFQDPDGYWLEVNNAGAPAPKP